MCCLVRAVMYSRKVDNFFFSRRCHSVNLMRFAVRFMHTHINVYQFILICGFCGFMCPLTCCRFFVSKSLVYTHSQTSLDPNRYLYNCLSHMQTSSTHEYAWRQPEITNFFLQYSFFRLFWASRLFINKRCIVRLYSAHRHFFLSVVWFFNRNKVCSFQCSSVWWSISNWIMQTGSSPNDAEKRDWPFLATF